MKHILVGFHGSEEGRDAIDLAQALAGAAGATLTVATVIGRHDHAEREAATERLAGYVTAHLGDLEIAVEARCVVASSSAGGLRELAVSTGADLIVLGSSRRGPIGRIVPGGTAKRLLRDAPCGIAVAPRGFASRPDSKWHPLSELPEEFALRVIGVGYDGSPEAEEALRLATEFALRCGAALRVFAVLPPVFRHPSAPDPEDGGADLRGQLDLAVSGLPVEVRAQAVALRGSPVTELIEATEKGIDLLVLGSRGGGAFRRAAMGSVSNGVIENVRCPVLVASREAGSREAVAASWNTKENADDDS
jgi:nucleotide-binding universal stress UspA family protein